jgi:hypothetical protein
MHKLSNIEDLLDGIATKNCENCQNPITSNRTVLCTVSDNAQFCSELCEQEYETNTRDQWSGETNERLIFSTSSY